MDRLRFARRQRLHSSPQTRETSATGVPDGTIKRLSDRRAIQVRQDGRWKSGFDRTMNRPVNFRDSKHNCND